MSSIIHIAVQKPICNAMAGGDTPMLNTYFTVISMIHPQ